MVKTIYEFLLQRKALIDNFMQGPNLSSLQQILIFELNKKSFSSRLDKLLW